MPEGKLEKRKRETDMHRAYIDFDGRVTDEHLDGRMTVDILLFR